jgi:hypothetical protein
MTNHERTPADAKMPEARLAMDTAMKPHDWPLSFPLEMFFSGKPCPRHPYIRSSGFTE